MRGLAIEGLVAPRDVPALADALDILLRDGSVRQRMGSAAAQWVREAFSIEHMRRSTADLYAGLL